MKKIICTLAALALCGAAAFAQDVLGKWKMDDGSAIVEIYKKGDVFCGKVVWIAEPLGQDGKPLRDENNPDKALRSREVMGLNLLIDLKDKGNAEYGDGKIYDPGNGKTYNCSMKVEGDVLKVRGSLDKKGLIGRTMDWFRVK